MNITRITKYFLPTFTIVAGLFVCFANFSNLCYGQDEAEATMIKKSSFVIGFNIAQNMISQGVEVDQEAMVQGIAAAFRNEELPFSDEEVEDLMNTFQQFVQGRAEQKLRQAAEVNRTEGENFVTKFAQLEGVRKLENGVMYQILQDGAGASPTPQNTVRIHYHGTLPDGKVFDSSVQRNQPAEFPVNAVVPGFSAALQAMNVGSKWKVVIPSELAYGAQGPPPIGPNRTLIFEIELLEIMN